MNEPIRFSLPIIPPTATAQQKGVFVTPTGKALFYERANVKAARKLYQAAMARFRPPVAMSGALRVGIEFHFPYRSAERKATVAAGVPLPHCCRPDLDNMAKGLLDVMQRLGFYEDDGQIAWLSLRKLWSPRPRIDVEIVAMAEQAEPVKQETFCESTFSPAKEGN